MHADQRLKDLDVLVVDCQATAASPGKGHLFEVAWGSAWCPRGAIESTLVRLPNGEKIPPRVGKMTGVCDADLAISPFREDVAKALTARIDGWRDAVFVAHWARYERAWFQDLLGHEMDWICTHEVARRLLPGLPRKGLRAVAGYLGRPLDDSKRAGEHVEATRYVWRELVGLLEERGVDTLDELWRWLEHPPAKTDERLYPLETQKRLSLPKQPGVYRMLNKNGRVLYVGKASSLKDRVNSYFRQRKLANDKMELVSQVWDLDVTVTDSALEAAVLETDEIKRLSPPYNHALRAEGRAVSWCSATDLRDASSSPSDRHTLGPFSGEMMREHFAECLEFINGATRLSRTEAAPEVLDKGRERFRRVHGVDQRLTVAEMLALGSALHPLPDDDGDEDAPSVTVVTAETVQKMLERAVVGAYRAVSRGAWLQRLSDSRLRWAPHHDPTGSRELPVVANELTTIDDYDRASVVLAEIRRILRDGREIVVVESSGNEMNAELLSAELDRF